MSISGAGISAYAHGVPVEVTVLVGLPIGSETVKWIGHLTACTDSYLRLDTSGNVGPADHFWLHQRPDELVSLESFNGQFVVMWFGRLAARAVQLELDWQAFSSSSTGIDSSVLVGDKERTGRYLTLETELSAEHTDAAAGDGDSGPLRRLTFAAAESNALHFKFVLTADQHSSPRAALQGDCATRDSFTECQVPQPQSCQHCC